LGIEDVELEPVLLEDAGALAEIGGGAVPDAALAYGELELVGRLRGRAQRRQRRDHDHALECSSHALLPSARRVMHRPTRLSPLRRCARAFVPGRLASADCL